MADPNQVLEGSQPVDLSKHPSGIVPTLQNIVSTVNLDCKLDLKAIALQARNAEYNPKVCTRAKSEQQSKLAARKYAQIVQKLGFPAKFKDFKIQNIVGSCDVKFPIRLESLAYSHGPFSSYEPELFPGLIYRMKQPKIVLLIFVSGKIVRTGAKVRDKTYTALENIYPVLTEFRKTQQWEVEGSSEEQDMDRRVSNRLVLPEDGFEWRKYGQKFIKNIGKMRSYYKCQKSNCIAKKQVEWSVSEPGNLRIVYQAEHNHLSPRQTSSTTATTTATANPYDLLTQVLGDHNQTSTSSRRRHDN